jgi:hypothetical protein
MTVNVIGTVPCGRDAVRRMSAHGGEPAVPGEMPPVTLLVKVEALPA